MMKVPSLVFVLKQCSGSFTGVCFEAMRWLLTSIFVTLATSNSARGASLYATSNGAKDSIWSVSEFEQALGKGKGIRNKPLMN